MKIAIGSDHRGYRGKSELLEHLRSSGHDVKDFGCLESATVDCADIARLVAAAVARNECDVGILVGGIGAGMCIAANKVPGIRAAVVHDEFLARRSRERHQCNVLCLAGELQGINDMLKVADHFLLAEQNWARHSGTVAKLSQIEQMSWLMPPGEHGEQSDELSETEDAADPGTQAGKALVAKLSHKLRAPLSPALSAAESLEEDTCLPRRIRDKVRLIRRCIELEVRLIDTLLGMTRDTPSSDRSKFNAP